MRVFGNKKQEGEDLDYFQPWEGERGKQKGSRRLNEFDEIDIDMNVLEPTTAAGVRAEPTEAPNCPSVISSGSEWQGNLKIESSVRIDGRLSGGIEAGDTVQISEGAMVDAKINAKFVVVAGTFQGHLNCRERLELLPTSLIKGEFTTKLLTVHEGAFIDGQLHMVKPEEQGFGKGPQPARAPSVSSRLTRDKPEPAASSVQKSPGLDFDRSESADTDRESQEAALIADQQPSRTATNDR